MPNSSPVVSGTDILATAYNDLRDDVFDSSTGHNHDGTDGKSLSLNIAIPAVTATPAEINQALDGISANVTDTNLNTLTGASNADALHVHTLAGGITDLTSYFKFGGDGSDGALNVTSGTTNIDVGGAYIYALNYTTFNISSGATLSFSNPSTYGTVIIIRCQGAVTINGTLDLPEMGASAGIGGVDGHYGSGSQKLGNPGTAGEDCIQPFKETLEGGLGRGGGEGDGITYGPAEGGESGETIPPNVYQFIFKINEERQAIASTGAGGGGGGAGGNRTSSYGNLTNMGDGGNGGRGGGGLIMECNTTFTLGAAGDIDLSGGNGSNGTNGTSIDLGAGGGGGGGAGGRGAILYKNSATILGSSTVTGGSGGTGGNNYTPGSWNTYGDGGGGGAGGSNVVNTGTDGNDGTIGTAGVKTGGDGGAGGAGEVTITKWQG